MGYSDHLVAEAASWAPGPEYVDKMRRERIRHYKLIRDLLLDKLGTDEMDILEVGGGPMPVSDLLPFRSRCVVDPCTKDYKKHVNVPDHYNSTIEEMLWPCPLFDLAIATNSLDHVKNPWQAVSQVDRALRPGGYFAVLCAENNARTNPHPAHEYNLTPEWIHGLLDAEYETVWELNFKEHGYRYGWVSYKGKRGQPAFAILFRKCNNYSS